MGSIQVLHLRALHVSGTVECNSAYLHVFDISPTFAALCVPFMVCPLLREWLNGAYFTEMMKNVKLDASCRKEQLVSWLSYSFFFFNRPLLWRKQNVFHPPPPFKVNTLSLYSTGICVILDLLVVSHILIYVHIYGLTLRNLRAWESPVLILQIRLSMSKHDV